MTSDFNKILGNLTPEEQKLALQALSELENKGSSSVLDALYKADYREIPVSPAQFIDDQEYFKHEGKNLYPIWRQHFIDVYSGNTDIYHIILSGGIGCGKDFFTMICLSYELYRIGCLRNPHEFFGMAASTNIVIALVSITKFQTRDVLFNGLKNMIDASPWFQKHFKRNMDRNDMMEFSSPLEDENLAFGKILVMYGAPTNASVIGQNVISAVIDEANFMEVIEKSKKVRGVDKEFNQAQMLYSNILRRMESRYKAHGKMPGKLILISSKQYPDDFVEKKIRELRDTPGVAIFEHSFYEVKRWAFAKEEFQVEVGDERFPPRIIGPNDKPRHGAEVINVPIDFKQAFQLDIEGALRDISGRASLTVNNFLRQRDRLFSCISEEFVNPYTAQRTDFEDGEALILEALAKVDKTAPRAIHLDLSKSGDSTGFAMSHIVGLKEVERVQMNDSMLPEIIIETLPVFRTDLMLEIVAPANAEIRYNRIRALIYKLRELGFQIMLVTADKYQSHDMLQILEDNGFETDYISVDTSLEPYYNLRTAIYEGRFEFYHHDKFIDEMINLEEDSRKRKIDHRHGKSKDISDAVAGSIWGLVKLGLVGSEQSRLPASLGYFLPAPAEPATKEETTDDFDEEFVYNCYGLNRNRRDLFEMNKFESYLGQNPEGKDLDEDLRRT